MLETPTLDAVCTPLQQSAEPEVVIDRIFFEEGKLWKPRYPSLIDYSLVLPGYQMEPAIQITDLMRRKMTVRLGLAAGFVFQTVGTEVKAQWIDGQGSPPPSSISAVLEGPGTCLVTWTRETSSSSPSTVALRFFCQPETGPKPEDPESVVEGGVYLAFVVREETWAEEVIEYLREHPVPDFTEPLVQPSGDAEKMRVLALLLPEGHIKYNLFKHTAPEGTELELAFRVRRHSAPLRFDVSIVNPNFVYKPKSESPEEVDREVTYPAGSTDPAELATLFGEQASICSATWTSQHPDDESGLSCSFNMIAKLEERELSFRPVDPTIIEPPLCSGGICTN